VKLLALVPLPDPAFSRTFNFIEGKGFKDEIHQRQK
jgi:hypothetical protein